MSEPYDPQKLHPRPSAILRQADPARIAATREEALANADRPSAEAPRTSEPSAWQREGEVALRGLDPRLLPSAHAPGETRPLPEERPSSQLVELPMTTLPSSLRWLAAAVFLLVLGGGLVLLLAGREETAPETARGAESAIPTASPAPPPAAETEIPPPVATEPSAETAAPAPLPSSPTPTRSAGSPPPKSPQAGELPPEIY
jgi:hypothetical protein